MRHKECTPAPETTSGWRSPFENDTEWEALVRVVGGELGANHHRTPAGRRDHHDEIDRAIAAWSANRNKLEAMLTLQAAGVRAGAVMTNRDIDRGRAHRGAEIHGGVGT